MGLFDSTKKKLEGAKPLSEVEIQSRLYGDFRPPHVLEKKSTDAPKAASAISGKPAEPQTRPLTGDFFSTANIQKNASTAVINPSHQPSTRVTPSAAALKSAEPMKSQAPFKSADSSKSGVGESPLKNMQTALLAGAQFLITSIVGLFWLFFNFFKQQNPSIKRKAPWLIGASILCVSFLGIQALNNQRESAMKNPKIYPRQKIVIPQAVLPDTPQPAPEDLKPNVKTAEVKLSNAELSIQTGEAQKGSQAQSALKSTETATSAAAEALAKPFVLQVATYVNRVDAEKMAESIKSLSFSAFIQSARRQSGRIYYLVFIGRFTTYEEADAALRRFKKLPIASTFPDTFARKLLKST